MTSEQIFLYFIGAMLAYFFIRRQWNLRGVKQYSAAEARERVKSGSVLLDVRTARERQSRSIPSSLHIPLHELKGRMKELERHKTAEIICYCASGSRSIGAAAQLKRAGFTAGNLTGGIASWNFSHR